MAALPLTRPTLLDLARRMDPDGGVASDIVEILNQTNEILLDQVFVEGNLTAGHQTTVRTGLPTPTWRLINEGVQPGKSTTVQAKFSTGSLWQYAEVDKELVDMNSNAQAWRMSEDQPFIEAMNQEMAGTLFYGNETTEPEAFTGLSAYYSDLTAPAADNMISGGSADTDNGSIWLVVWGEQTIFGIVPKGIPAGLTMEDKGVVTLEDASGSNGGRMEAYRSLYTWRNGLVVKDWRFAVRIYNIDKSLLTPDVSTGANLPRLMFRAMRLIPNLRMGRPAFYMSRDMATMLAEQIAEKTSNSTLTATDVGGDEGFTERFKGIPVRRCDALAADEALIS